ncbi:hypothetical protein L1887_58137 [Cichorium endivia]|nr:hypothetical protein L1887_58137 [Cichorium endivia]
MQRRRAERSREPRRSKRCETRDAKVSEGAKEERFQGRREGERVPSGRRGMGWRAREIEEEEKEVKPTWRENVDPCGYRTLVPLFAVPADARSMRCGLPVDLGLSLLLPQSSDVGELKPSPPWPRQQTPGTVTIASASP